MSNKKKNTGFGVVCDECGKILDMPPVNDGKENTTKKEDCSEPRNGGKHHLSNYGTKRPGYRR